MSHTLPAALQVGLDACLEGKSRKDLAARAAKISEAYRAGGRSHGVVRELDDALAYAITRLPATFAAAAEVCERLIERRPDFAPTTLLDAGAGGGAASWAATEAWASLAQLTQLDHSTVFLDLAHRLAAASPRAALNAAAQVRASIETWSGSEPPFDLILFGYSLTELPPEKLKPALEAYWARCSGALVMIEPGTPAGFARILRARQTLSSQGAQLLAPCPHQADCPLIAPDWCHFSVRLPRRRDHMHVKGAQVPFEDEKFAYLIAVRQNLFTPATESRILAPVERDRIGAAVKLCTPSGAAEIVQVGKRDKAAASRLKKLDWGDVYGA